jgi:hypothetical protein
MNSRIWRSGALAASIAMVVLLSTQRASGQPPAVSTVSTVSTVQRIPQALLTNADAVTVQPASTLPAIPESASLLLLGSAFAVAARQLRRMI